MTSEAPVVVAGSADEVQLTVGCWGHAVVTAAMVNKVHVPVAMQSVAPVAVGALAADVRDSSSL